MAAPLSLSIVAPNMADVSVIPVAVGLLKTGGVIASPSMESKRKITRHQKDTRDSRVKSKAGKMVALPGLRFGEHALECVPSIGGPDKIVTALPVDTGKAGFNKSKCVPFPAGSGQGVRERDF